MPNSAYLNSQDLSIESRDKPFWTVTTTLNGVKPHVTQQI